MILSHKKIIIQLLAFFNNTKEVGYEGDVSVSKPAKNPMLTISDEDSKNLLSFINKKDTGSYDGICNGRKRYAA